MYDPIGRIIQGKGSKSLHDLACKAMHDQVRYTCMILQDFLPLLPYITH